MPSPTRNRPTLEFSDRLVSRASEHKLRESAFGNIIVIRKAVPGGF